MSAPITFPPELDALIKREAGKYKFPFMLAPTDPWGGPFTKDITGWWISEKLDGVRALWTGSEFISRGAKEGGKVYNAPASFKRRMPQGVVLDGELWLGRGKFDECSGICRRDDGSEHDWNRLTYVVFDAPLTPGIFEDRIAYVEKLCARDGLSHIVAHKHSKLESMDQVPALLKLVEDMGGEGLIARRPGSEYDLGRRSKHMLKIITKFREEGEVVGYEPGKGKHLGRMGCLLVKTESGVIAEVGTGFTDRERDNPPALGKLVTYEYRVKNKETGKPRFPAYIGVRDYE
jgi:DNA ligase-1